MGSAHADRVLTPHVYLLFVDAGGRWLRRRIEPAAAPGGMPTMKMVGPSGGAVSSSDGNLAVNIPAGALPADVTITTEPAAAPAAGAVGTVYEIGPTGTQFAMPVTLTLHYDMTRSQRRHRVVAARRHVRRWIVAAFARCRRRYAGEDGLGRDDPPVALRDRDRDGRQDLRDGADGVRMRRDRRTDRWRRLVERRDRTAEHRRRRDGRQFVDMRSAYVRRRDERLRAIPGRRDGQLR